ncbi:histidine kinase dimerization/phosphoacceptor domain -containing protein [Jejudonia soesokkakensis]|uniref:histidine kinase n=1 Tax=Jejudonia soesokkakensis TaxID=1323432 RepID=A0ABW2MN96_9FLAO
MKSIVAFIVLGILFFSVTAVSQNAENVSLFNPIETPSQFLKTKQKLLTLTAKRVDYSDQAVFKDYLPFANALTRWSKQNGSDEDIVYANYCLFQVLYHAQKDLEAISIGERIFPKKEMLLEMHQYWLLDALLALYSKIEAYDDVLRLLPYKQEEFFKKYNVKGRGNTYKEDLAMTLYKIGDYAKAVRYFKEQAPEYKSVGNQLMTSSMYNNAGLSFFKMKEYDSALVYYEKSIVEISLPGSSKIEGRDEEYKKKFKNIILGNIAEIEFEKGNIDKALKTFLVELNDNTREYQIVTAAYYNVARAYYKKGEIALATKYIDSALTSVTSYNEINSIVKLYDLKGKLLLYDNNIKEAENYFNKKEVLQDSIRNIQIKRKSNLAAAKFNVDFKERELITTKQEVASKTRALRNQLIALFITLLLLGLLTYFYVRSVQDKRTISQQTASLETSLHEKEVLLKEVHHRVKNNLQVISSLLQLQSKKATDDTMKKALNDSQRHIHSMALVHQMLYQQDQYTKIPMQSYLKKLVDQLLYSLSGTHINSLIEVENIELSIDKAIPLGLMLSELITNTNKYAFDDETGMIHVELKGLSESEKIKTYHFSYSDNGKGLAPDYKDHISKTMGFRLIFMLAEEMDGAIEVQGDKGLKVKVVFKEIRI